MGALLFLWIEKQKIASFFKTKFAFKISLAVLLLAAGLPILVHAGISWWTERYWGLANVIDFSSDTTMKLLYIVALIPAAFGEEIGWRGYLLPKLQQRFSPLVSTLIVGIIWGGWHIPTKLVSVPFFVFWFLELQGFNFLFACVYNKAKPSIWSAILLHYVLDASGFLLLQQGIASIPAMSITWLAVGLLVLLTNWKAFSAKPTPDEKTVSVTQV